jgi:phospholipid/cholesterol/gamma-HCH transport system permease protein
MFSATRSSADVGVSVPTGALAGVLVGVAQRMRVGAANMARVWLLTAQLLALMLSPRSYVGPAGVPAMQQLVRASAAMVPSFMLLSALMSVVLVRIVLAAANELGLSQFALNVLIRSLVLELLPLVAAGFVALRYSLPAAHVVVKGMDHDLAGVEGDANANATTNGNATTDDANNNVNNIRASHRASPALHQALHQAVHQAVHQALKRAVAFASAGAFAVLLLAAASGVVASVIAYVSVYGLSLWGLAAFNALMAQIFTPTVMLVLAGKTLLSALAVATVPFSAALANPLKRSDLAIFARVVGILLVVELLSLVGNYY